MPLTIVDRVATPWREEPWLRFLLGDLAGDTVADPDGSAVLPGSVIVTQRPDLLTEEQRREIRATPGVGLFHLSDEWFKRPIASYGAFSWVWRQYAHSGLRGERLRALPLGPVSVASISTGLPDASRRPLAERTHPVAFIGHLVTTRFAAVAALATVPHALLRPTGCFDAHGEAMSIDEYNGALRDAAFVACPMGNANIESFRVYEALEAGAVPIVEARRGFDYFRLLLGPNPLPTVRSWSQAPALIAELHEDRTLGALQERTRSWWQGYKEQLRRSVRADVLDASGRRATVHGRHTRPVMMRELARHQNATALVRRSQLTAIRAQRRLLGRVHTT